MNKRFIDFELTKKETTKILNEIKKKKIKNMSILDLMFIIENDDAILSCEKIEYEKELFRKMLLIK